MKNKLMLLALAAGMIAGTGFAVQMELSFTGVTNKTDADIWINFSLTSAKGITKADYTRVKSGEKYKIKNFSSLIGATLSVVAYTCKEGKITSIKERTSIAGGTSNVNISLGMKTKKKFIGSDETVFGIVFDMQ